MRTMITILATTILFAMGLTVQAHEHTMPEAKSNKNFEQMKQLVGTWEGTTKKGDKEQTVKATYELTSGGNAILERLFVGTPNEMVSVYHPEGKTVAMTHYCMLGNQPTMTMKKSDGKSASFEVMGNKGLSSAKEMHMHALNIKWNGDKAMTEEWTSYNKGKKADTAVFNFKKM